MDRGELERILRRWGLSPPYEEILSGVEDDWEEGQVERHIIGYLLRDGDAGWEQIVKRCLPLGEGLIRRKVPQQDIEMVKLDFLSCLWERIRSYEGRGKLNSWLRKLAKCVIADYYRDKPKEIPIPEYYDEVDEDDICEEVSRRSLREEVERCLEELPKRLKVVAKKRFIEGKSMKEIAAEEGRATGTICSQCKKASDILREKLKKFSPDE